MTSSSDIPLQTRNAPSQSRSEKTLDAILQATAELLEESGFDALSTNGICRRAGLTPPALYRYFPNKYAVMKMLGERLMQRQNEVLEDWAAAYDGVGDQTEAIFMLLKLTLDVTRSMPAGALVMRSLHASPVLADVRLESHREVTELLVRQLVRQSPELKPEQVRTSMRLSVDIGYAVVEMVCDDDTVDETEALKKTAALLERSTILLFQQCQKIE